MKKLMGKLEELPELGGINMDITLLVISGAAILASLFKCRSFWRRSSGWPSWACMLLLIFE